jgi:hypothetical protein
MSHQQVQQLLERLKGALDALEQELADLGTIDDVEEIKHLLATTERLREVLTEAKGYFGEIRSGFAPGSGISPAKELAQLVIAGATEALGSIRETQHHLQEYQATLGAKVRALKTLDDLHYADFAAKEALRRTHYIIKRLTSFLEELPKEK